MKKGERETGKVRKIGDLNMQKRLNKKIIFSLLCVALLMPSFALPNVSRGLRVSSPAIGAPSDLSTDRYELLIIAPEEFRDALEPLKKFKDATYRPTLLISLEDIYSDPSFDGVDEAEEVKKCIAHYESMHGVEYVMLVGDCDKFPMRAHHMRSENATHVEWVVFYLTDHYYADLYNETGGFCDWDYNKNGLYGEANSFNGHYENWDHVDFHLDIAVGRVPASNVIEVSTYVDKIIKYETTTSFDSWWFKRALLSTGTNDPAYTDPGRYPGDVTQNDDIASKLSPLGFEIIKLYNESGYESPTPARINERLNEGVGFVNVISHANQYWWSYCYNVKDDMAGLDNAEMLPVIWSFGCHAAHFGPIAPFEPYIDVNGVKQPGGYSFPYPKGSWVEPPKPSPLQDSTTDVDSMAEYWPVKHEVGGIAFVGSTATAIRPQGFDMNDYFFDAFADGERILGDMWLSMSEDYLADPTYNPWNDRPAFTRYVRMNLFGDPSLWIGGIHGNPLQQWAVGSRDILHWDGSAWVQTRYISKSLRSVSMLSPTDGWAVGDDGHMRRWDGRFWGVLYDPPTSSDLYSVYMVGREDGWAVGEGGTILRWDGDRWTNFPSPESLDLYSVCMVNPTDGWAVGSNYILRYDGVSWTRFQRNPTSWRLYSVCMATQNDGWIVGASGTILRWNGVRWSTVASPTTEHLRSICVVGPASAWAVGRSGVILNWGGSSWRIVTSPTTADLYSVSAHAVYDPPPPHLEAWAVGAGGVILGPPVWTPITSPTQNDLFSVTCDPRNYPPVADCNGPYTGSVGTPIAFSASDSYDPEGDTLECLWDFGDGTTSTLMNPTHTYTQSGWHPVTLFVGDGKRWDTARTYAEVTTAPRAIELQWVRSWYWTDDTRIESVACANVDGDPAVEVVTGGRHNDGTRDRAQLCVWDGGTLQGVRTWYWVGNTWIEAVACGDVDGDGEIEVITGGAYYDGSRYVAQLCVWDGSSLALEGVKTWYWTSHTRIHSVAVGDVDGDGETEIITGGYQWDYTVEKAQLVVWDGSTLALEVVRTWYWVGNTHINSIAVGDVDGDGQNEIVTGGRYDDLTRIRAQLCVWSGSLALEDVKTWHWTGDTYILSVACGDADGDGQNEIVTGGWYDDGTRWVAQLCVWTGSTLALEDVKTWYCTSSTYIRSVAVGDVDGDGETEIVTGGRYDDGTRQVAQLTVWDGSTLALENVVAWYWVNDTRIYSVAVGDVDGDGQTEIVTGGWYDDGTRDNAQLCVWGFT